MDYSKFIGLLKKIKYNIISDNVSIIELCDNNQDIEYIKQAILFDNTNMCFYGSNYRDDYQSFIDDFSDYIASSSINYAVFYQEKFIGLFMAWYHDYEKDKKRFAIGYVIDEKYRNCGIGAYAFEKFLEIITQLFIEQVNNIVLKFKIELNIEKATLGNLDLIGQLIGITRNFYKGIVLDDETYRFFIKMQIAKNKCFYKTTF